MLGSFAWAATVRLGHTYNERGLTDLDRFLVVLGMVAGRRLTYKALTGKA